MKTTKERERLSPEEASVFRNIRCPDCEEQKLVEGPCGGLSINIYCTNPKCGSKFNDMGPFGIERISDAQPDKSPAPPDPKYVVGD